MLEVGHPVRCTCDPCLRSWNEIAHYLRSTEPPASSGGLWYGDPTAVERGRARDFCGRADLEKLDSRSSDLRTFREVRRIGYTRRGNLT